MNGLMLKLRRSAFAVAAAFLLILVPLGRNPLAEGKTLATTTERGTLTAIATVNPQTLPPASQSSGSPHAMPVRLRPGVSPFHNSNANAPTVNPTVLGPSSSAPLSLGQNFPGVDEIDNLLASGTPLEPPDEGLGVGGNFVFNLVNVTGAIYRRDGTIYGHPFAANTFFHEPATAFTSDPRVYFDASTHTWFATILEADFANGTESHFDLAVNTNPNPISPWKIFRINTTDIINNGCPCFGDYPELGMDRENVYVSTNEFSILGPTYNGAQIYAISKSQLEGGTSANYVHFDGLSAGGTITYHLQPATDYSNTAPAEYFLESLDPTGTWDNRLAIFAMTNEHSVTTGIGTPQLTSTVIQSEPYGSPVLARTPGGFNGFTGLPTTGLVDPDTDWAYELEYINGHLDDTITTSVTIPGDPFPRDGAAWVQVKPVLSGNSISSATSVINQGYVASFGNYILYPHVNENAAGEMAMTFTIGGPTTFLSAAYTARTASQSDFGVINIAGGGAAPDNGFTATAPYGSVGRWGDYSNGEVDTAGNFWLATQYIPNGGDQFANWGNYIMEVNG